jgi:hypothetical protein
MIIELCFVLVLASVALNMYHLYVPQVRFENVLYHFSYKLRSKARRSPRGVSCAGAMS